MAANTHRLPKPGEVWAVTLRHVLHDEVLYYRITRITWDRRVIGYRIKSQYDIVEYSEHVHVGMTDLFLGNDFLFGARCCVLNEMNIYDKLEIMLNDRA